MHLIEKYILYFYIFLILLSKIFITPIYFSKIGEFYFKNLCTQNEHILRVSFFKNLFIYSLILLNIRVSIVVNLQLLQETRTIILVPYLNQFI